MDMKHKTGFNYCQIGLHDLAYQLSSHHSLTTLKFVSWCGSYSYRLAQTSYNIDFQFVNSITHTKPWLRVLYTNIQLAIST